LSVILNTTILNLIVKTFHGLENVLAKELKELGAENIAILKRAVSFDADKALLYKSNLRLRTALRILLPLTSFSAKNEDELYTKVKAFDWSPYLHNNQTLAVDAITFSNIFKHSKYVALKAKDAICDQFREKTGKRPSVDLISPTIQINLHIAEDKVTLSIDSSGEPLNRRGYRTQEHPATINEVLAAGMILMSGWDGKSVQFLDPMCGSGTLVMEAAMIASQMAPNLKRKEFGFMRWNDFDPNLWKEIVNEAKSAVATPAVNISGSDIDVRAIDVARQSALDFGLKQYINFAVKPFAETRHTGRGGVIIMNPPYDERLKSKDIVKLYSEIGRTFKHTYTGWDAWVISSNMEALKMIGLKPSSRHVLFNGSLECRFQQFSLYEGTKKGASVSE
jgi:putative N6-adenine-specific DNA methylase